MSGIRDTESLYPLLPILEADWLDVGDGHRIYNSRSGNPQGIPVLLLHGGPASGSSAHHARFFEPERYQIFQFDQRGSGKSTPLGERGNNTTDALISDIEKLRLQMGVRQWLVMGGSWGSALALLYAARHPDACSGLLLRGVFLANDADLHWYFHEMRHLLPREWDEFSRAARLNPTDTLPGNLGSLAGACEHLDLESADCVPTSKDLINAYVKELENVESAGARDATAAYMQWERALGAALAPTMTTDTSDNSRASEPEVTSEQVLKYRLQLHYMAHGCFVRSGDVLASAISLSAHSMPVAIVHGRRDCICRPGNAWQVFHAIEGSRLQLIDNTGHDPFSDQMVQATMSAISSFANNGDFKGWVAEKHSCAAS